MFAFSPVPSQHAPSVSPYPPPSLPAFSPTDNLSLTPSPSSTSPTTPYPPASSTVVSPTDSSPHTPYCSTPLLLLLPSSFSSPPPSPPPPSPHPPYWPGHCATSKWPGSLVTEFNNQVTEKTARGGDT